MEETVIICRVSSKEQEETGYSLPAQRKLLEDYCHEHNLNVKKVFSISESASGAKQRKLFNEILVYLVKNHITNLVVEKTDRLTRNFYDAVTVDKWIKEEPSRRVHFVKENFVLHKESKSNEVFIWNIKVAVAQYYIDNLSEEVRKGQKEKLAQGWLPTKPPLGYKTIGEKGHRIHVIDEATKHFAENMFKYYVSGDYSLYKLANRLFDEGLRSENGYKVPKSRIHEYLTDPFYTGLNRWKGKVTQGSQQTFIEKDVFDKVQLLLKGKTTPKTNKHNFPFKSLIKCDECEGTITWEIQKGTNYGHCNHYRQCSQLKWAIEKDLIKQVVPSFEALKVKDDRLLDWIRRALKETHVQETKQFSQALEAFNTREEQIKKRLSALYDDKLDGKITEEFYNDKSREYNEERNEIINQRKKLNVKDTDFYDKTLTIYDVAMRAGELFENAKDDKKRRLMRLVLSDMRLLNTVLSFKYTHAYELLHQAIQETNSSKVAGNEHFMEKIFELKDFGDVEAKKESLKLDCSTWLPRVDSNHEP